MEVQIEERVAYIALSYDRATTVTRNGPTPV